MSMENMERNPFKTKLTISGKEFNLNSILNLLKKNDIKIAFFGGLNKTPGSLFKITEKNIPLEEAYMILEAPEERVREVLLNSEFKDKIDLLLGHALN